MGMNIYTLDGRHVGKRYAAGMWCWDCRVECACKRRTAGGTLYEARDSGDPLVHWRCPRCGAVMTPAEHAARGGFNPAMRELGLDVSPPRAHRGIDGASG